MRLALGIEYDGTDFLGWQRLGHGPTVQASVEKALSTVADHPVNAICAGRTDSGVHAHCQVAHFDTHADRSMRSWMLGASAELPRGISVIWARPVADTFHARHEARGRRYRYVILNRMVRPALEARYVTWERHPLDVARMHRAAQALVGTHDFSAFRSIACQAPHARRDVRHIQVTRAADHVCMEIEASAFLHHMVRNIIGSLLPVGRGEREPGWPGDLLEGRNRALAGPTAPSSGLSFIGPLYPAAWGLPEQVTL